MEKVLVWGATDTMGGVEAVLWNYVSHISPDEIQFDFINTYKDISIGDKVAECGSKIIALPNRKKHYFEYRKAISEFMKQHAKEYSAVWLNDCMFGNIDILKYAKRYGIPKRIVHAHNSLNMGGGKSRLIRHKINSYLMQRYVTDYWACSQLAADWSYPSAVKKTRKIEIIQNAVDTSVYSFDENLRKEYREKLGLSNNIVLGHVGRFHYQKNHPFLIDIFAEVKKLEPRAVLLLIGDGEDKEKIVKKIEDKKLKESVILLGLRKDVNTVYQAMDAFVLPSLFEGLPVVMVEAQASGLPCYVADTITRESDITGNVEFIPLEKSAEEWAHIIVDGLNKFKRTDVRTSITENGYSIDEAAKKLEKQLKN